MLEVSGLNVYYDNIRALKDVSFSVEEGEIMTLIGANGAGKTTTLLTLSGLKKAQSGTIQFLGKDITKSTPQSRVAMGISQSPEGRRVFPGLTVLEKRSARSRPRALCLAASSRCWPWAGRS